METRRVFVKFLGTRRDIRIEGRWLNNYVLTTVEGLVEEYEDDGDALTDGWYQLPWDAIIEDKIRRMEEDEDLLCSSPA